MHGVVIRLLSDRQFGFINSDGKEYFFHRDDCGTHWNSIVENFGTKPVYVEFNEVPSNKGKRAGQVVLL